MVMQEGDEHRAATEGTDEFEPDADATGARTPGESPKPKLEIIHDADAARAEDSADLDDDEKEYRAQRRDLPGVKGSSAVGIVSINVGKIPGKNMFFRTHTTFSPVINLVDTEVGMEKQYFTATPEMERALAGIAITMSPYTLYLTVTEEGAVKIIPVRCPDEDGCQNEYGRTKELGLIHARTEWVRLYTDLKNKNYKWFTAPKGRFAEPVWPELEHSKIFRLAFRDKGHRIDSPHHPLFMKWAGRANDKK
jgi:hypothetical protein